MKINIVNYEKGYGENWIFTSLAEKIHSGFQQIGLTSSISSSRLDNYDTNTLRWKGSKLLYNPYSRQ